MKETKVREITQITMLGNWTTPERQQFIKDNDEKYINGISKISFAYDSEVNETYITIITVYHRQCDYCAHGTCVLENICCDGYGDCNARIGLITDNDEWFE